MQPFVALLDSNERVVQQFGVATLACLLQKPTYVDPVLQALNISGGIRSVAYLSCLFREDVSPDGKQTYASISQILTALRIPSSWSSVMAAKEKARRAGLELLREETKLTLARSKEEWQRTQAALLQTSERLGKELAEERASRQDEKKIIEEKEAMLKTREEELQALSEELAALRVWQKEWDAEQQKREEELRAQCDQVAHSLALKTRYHDEAQLKLSLEKHLHEANRQRWEEELQYCESERRRVQESLQKSDLEWKERVRLLQEQWEAERIQLEKKATYMATICQRMAKCEGEVQHDAEPCEEKQELVELNEEEENEEDDKTMEWVIV